jgi:hypothetical protein
LKLGKETSRQIYSGRKESNFAKKPPGGVAEYSSSTTNEFQNLRVPISRSKIQTRTMGFNEK